MIDVHVPEKSEHTWTDFFIHIGTIAVGLLLAIGLEQSVEAIHHAHQRQELRAALYAESAQIAKDSRDTREWTDYFRLLTSVRMAQLRALRDKRPAPLLLHVASPAFDSPADPIWEAAKTSQSAALLSRDEVTAYGELNDNCAEITKQWEGIQVARNAAAAYASRFDGNWLTADLSHASREEMQEMIERLQNLNEVVAMQGHLSSQAEGAAEAVHSGERDITKLYAAEKSAEVHEDKTFRLRLASALAVPSAGSAAGGSR